MPVFKTEISLHITLIIYLMGYCGFKKKQMVSLTMTVSILWKGVWGCGVA